MQYGKLVLHLKEILIEKQIISNPNIGKYYYVAKLSQTVFRSGYSKGLVNGIPDSCILEIDLFQESRILADRHIGRVEIRLSDHINRTQKNESWFNIYSRNDAPSTQSIWHQHRLDKQSVGQMRIMMHFHPEDLYSNLKEIYTEIEQDREDGAVEADMKMPSSFLNSSVSNLEATTLVIPTASEYATIESMQSLIAVEDQFEEELGIFSQKIEGPIGYLFSAEVARMIKGFQNLIYIFGQGIRMSTGKLMLGYFLVENFYDFHVDHLHSEKNNTSVDLIKSPTELTPEIDKDEIQLAKTLWKYCLCTFGWRGLSITGKTGNNIWTDYRKKDDVGAIKTFLNIDDVNSRIIKIEMSSKREQFTPSYYLMKDSRLNALILGIRGTMDANDTNIDLACEYVPWKNGYVHQGIHAAAKWFIRNLYSTLYHELCEGSLENFYIVGHSLGGATGSLLCILLKEYLKSRPSAEQKVFQNIRCFSYGPAPTLSKSLLSPVQDQYIVNIVYAYDLIASLCYGTVMDFRQILLCASEIWDSQDLWKKNTKKESQIATEKSKLKMQTLAECRELVLQSPDKNLKLYIPGKVYHVYEEKEGEGKFTIKRKNGLSFNELMFKKSCLKCHLPTYYDKLIGSMS